MKLRSYERLLQEYYTLQCSLEGPAVPEDLPVEDIVALDRSLASSLLQQYRTLLASLQEISASASLCIELTQSRKEVASSGPGFFLIPPSGKISGDTVPTRRRRGSEPRAGAGKQVPSSISSKGFQQYGSPGSPGSSSEYAGSYETGSSVMMPGTKAASFVGSDWILTLVVDYDAKSGLYTVEDEEAESEDAKFYQLPAKLVLELPFGRQLHLQKNDHVLAMYPDATTFYSATLVRKGRDHVIVHFADDQDEYGVTPARRVHSHHCVGFPTDLDE